MKLPFCSKFPEMTKLENQTYAYAYFLGENSGNRLFAQLPGEVYLPKFEGFRHMWERKMRAVQDLLDGKYIIRVKIFIVKETGLKRVEKDQF